MAVTIRSAISFGLVYIPVELYTATQDNDIHFNQLVKDNNERVRYKKTCKSCKKELNSSDIVKGFQYEKDKYVVITDEDFNKIKTEKDRSIRILQFTDLSQIPAVYYNKAYQANSQKGGEKAFELLRQAMLRQNKVAVGKTVLGNSETMLALIPTPNGMLLQTLFYYDEVKQPTNVAAPPQVDKQELDMAEQLVTSMDKPFEPKQYHDEYQQRLQQLIESKIEGKQITVPKEAKENNTINLMDALKASLEQTKPRKTKKKKEAGA